LPRNWDQYYTGSASLDFTPASLLVEVAELMPPGRALDLACGAGRNALYLAGLGWHVTAVDSSAAAIGVLRERAGGLPVDARLGDLERGEFTIAPGSFDLICDFLYLQRDLFPQIREGVRPGGTLAGAILVQDGAPDQNVAFRLRPGELREEFAGWKILFYSEAAGCAQIVARRA
jgi:tellurite methyltransferase